MGNFIIFNTYINYKMKIALYFALVGMTLAAIGDACASDGECGSGEVCGGSNECEVAPAPAPSNNADTPKVDPSTGMRCSMDGYVNLVRSFIKVALAGLVILKDMGTFLLPATLRRSVDYAFRGIQGMGDWIGYALAAGYFAAEDQGMGGTFCMAMGYANIGLDTLKIGVESIEMLSSMKPW